MPLKIIIIEPKIARVGLVVAALLCIITAWFFVKWNFANMVASRLDIDRPESKLVVDGLIDLAPSDPQTHYTAAALYEKTFNSTDLTRSLSEYESAAALSPNNYLMWLNLGRIRNLNGDIDGADAAYSRAAFLAPNYAQVQWVYGNFMIRQDKTDEGFTLIAKAAAANPEYSQAAALTALQIFDADMSQVRHALGDNDMTNAALASALAGQKHFAEAVESWSRLAAVDRSGKFKKLGESLVAQIAEAKKFSLAARVVADLQTNDAQRPVIGQLSNGGFENGVKLRDASLFEWVIADGGEPQIGLSESQKRSGKYGLVLSFNSLETVAFRSVVQTVAVVPGAEYEFEVFYKSDVKTAAKLKWEIADAVTAGPITSTAPLTIAADWTSQKVTFKVPAGIDGVIIRFVREGCGGPTCPTNGKLSFDDISIRQL